MVNHSPKQLSRASAKIGPGLVVMLADTDAGSIITAAQSGAVWGYKLLALQFILIPILYIVQELTLRMGLATGQGHGELIKKTFGPWWAAISITTLLICCVGAIITEFAGLASVGHLFGISTSITLSMAVIFLITLVWTGGYHSVERIALAVGAFELIFLYVAWRAHPSVQEIWQHMISIPVHNQEYLYLVAANIGAVIMPWMIFYQQSAILDKGLTTTCLKTARWDTAIGAILAQLIMASILIITATTIGKTHPGMPLNTIHQISKAITPTLGIMTGKILFALGMIGAALVAAIVVSLTAAWGLGEITGYRRSLQDKPHEAPWFYATYTLVLIIGSMIVASGINLVKLSIAVEVMNALLLPVVLGFLFLLARKALPAPYRLEGIYAFIVGVLLFVTSLFGLVAGIYGSIKHWN